jgi:hypothetical protein
MMADPVSQMAMMSSMTEELVKNKLRLEGERNDKPDDAFPRARYENQGLSEGASLDDAERNARFPWTHKSEPLDFHSIKKSPRKNQTAVPLC